MVSFISSRPRLPVALLNRLGPALGMRNRRGASLDADDLLATATRSTGLDDFGGDAFREPFERLLDSYRRDARLTLFGRMGVRGDLSRLLANRLLIADELARRPETASTKTARPLFVVGLPRTGTTLLYNLLALDPAHRPLRLWEAMEPVTHDRAGATAGGRDGRPARARRNIRTFHYLAPAARAMHPVDPDGPEECVPLLQNSFMSLQFEAMHNVSSYAGWLEGRDLSQTYGYYRNQLQILQSQRSGERWLLKSPAHLFALDCLLRFFPDACIVMTHRDPLRVMASCCSLIATLRRIASDDVDPLEIGRQWPAKWALALEKAMGVREKAAQEHFADVHYGHLLSDPVAAVNGIYSRFGFEVPAGMEDRMRAWLAGNAQHKYGKHRYSPSDFGLDATRERSRFAAYSRTFGVAEEGRDGPLLRPHP